MDADESLVCSVCKHVLRDAMEAPCGHAFCRVCLEELSKAAQLKGTYCLVHKRFARVRAESMSTKQARSCAKRCVLNAIKP